jgi:GNAT superfamily N-acetyltransferase
MTLQEETKLQITFQDVACLSKELQEEIDAVDHLAFCYQGAEDDDSIEWANSSTWFALGWLGGRLVTQFGVLNRTIQAGGQNLSIAGVGGVATHPDFQRRGFAADLLQAGADQMRRLGGYDFAMLYCNPKLIPYYAKSGYRQVVNPIYILQHGQRVLFEDHQMVLPLSGKPWPEGDVDVNGPPW